MFYSIAEFLFFFFPKFSFRNKCLPFLCILCLKINMLLNFKDDKTDCPCPEEIRDQLLDFHEDLMTHCGKCCY